MSDIKLVCWNANVNTIFLLRSGCYHIYGEMFFIIHGELKLEWFLLLPFFFPPLNRMVSSLVIVWAGKMLFTPRHISLLSTAGTSNY